MYYMEFGKRGNPTIVFLHGIGRVDIFSSYIEALSDNYHIILPHLYGNGEEVHKDMVLKTLTYDLLSLLQGIKKDKMLLVGKDFGGEVALMLLKKSPQMFSKCILIDMKFNKSYRYVKNTIKLFKRIQIKSRTFAKLFAKVDMRIRKIQIEEFDIMFEYIRNTRLDNLKHMLTDFDYRSFEFENLEVGGLVICNNDVSLDSFLDANYIVNLSKHFKMVPLSYNIQAISQAKDEIIKLIRKNT